MEKLGSRLTMFLLFALGIGFCCCATAPPVVQNPMVEIQMVSRPIRRVIAVMPFQVQAPGAYRIGEGIDDMVVTGLGESGYFQVVERKNLDRIMS
jgi:curli biogenesis system outer membrane secretion channel CsgG